jgi:hypothetical protein
MDVGNPENGDLENSRRLCSRSNGTSRGIPLIVSEFFLEIKKIGKAIKRLGFELA